MTTVSVQRRNRLRLVWQVAHRSSQRRSPKVIIAHDSHCMHSMSLDSEAHWESETSNDVFVLRVALTGKNVHMLVRSPPSDLVATHSNCNTYKCCQQITIKAILHALLRYGHETSGHGESSSQAGGQQFDFRTSRIFLIVVSD